MIRLSAFADEIGPEPAEQVAVLLRNGIRHVEFRSIHGINVLDVDGRGHEAFRALLRSEGIGLSAIGSPIGKAPIGEPFEAQLTRLGTALDLCAFYDCPRLRVFSYYLPADDDPAAYREEVLRRMEAKARIAESRGVLLVLENEKRIYGDTAERVHDIMTAVGSPALRHAFDPANYLEVGESIDAAWELLRPHVAHFHVKDLDPATGRNVPAGQGAGQIHRLLADAVARGYDGFCVLEPHLVVAEASYGFTGPERFDEAAQALKLGLDRDQVKYA